MSADGVFGRVDEPQVARGASEGRVEPSVELAGRTVVGGRD